ncbi:hypothetical protein [Tautonia rosea]|uniref:hypothetical protein n=1 Tax=Tautonia rosea TaxID=2728037 RepID=UPI0014753703|nr:hypothetical protein [Tautonia rosea]
MPRKASRGLVGWSRMLAWLGDEVRLLSIAGLALLVIGGVIAQPGWDGNQTKIAIQILMGSLFPIVLLLGAGVRRRAGPVGQGVRGVVLIALAMVAVGGIGWFLVLHFDPTLLALGLLNAALLALASAVQVRTEERRVVWEWCVWLPSARKFWLRLPGGLVRAVVVVASWFFAARLLYWGSLQEFLAVSLYPKLVLMGAMVLLSLNLANVGRPRGARAIRPRRRRWARWADLAALVLIVLASFRVDSLGGASAYDVDGIGLLRFAHWAAAVGPAELVRQGGWLLWDVPSTYGFLSVLLVAWMPVASPWQAYYLVHAMLTAATAVMLYGLLRSLRTGSTNYPFALLTTLMAAFLMPGIAFYLTGPSVHPPLSAYRYVWCYALLGVLVWESRAEVTGWRWWGIPAVGQLTWMLGVLWAPESAFYCSVMWLPGFAVMAWRRAVAGSSNGKPLRGSVIALRLIGWLLTVPLVVSAAVGIVSLWYQVGLGHLPDWPRFLDYVMAFTVDGVVMDDPHRLDGPIWVMLVLFCAISATVVARVGRGASCATMAPALGVWGMVWGASSYYVIRVNPLFLHCLVPIVCVGLAVLWGLPSRDRGRRRGAVDPARASVIPVLTMLMLIGFGNAECLRPWGPALRRGYIASVDRLMPTMNPDLAQLLARANLGPDDPITYLDNRNGPWEFGPLGVWPPADRTRLSEIRWRNRSWTPALPVLNFSPLANDRPALYMERFARRSQLGGWLIESKKTDARQLLPWFYQALDQTHVATDRVENEFWRLVRYEPREPIVARPDATASAPVRR